MAEPIKGIAYDFSIGLDSVLGTGFQANPTLAAGDFTISKDNGAFANLTTLPVVTPSGSTSVLVSLSATEMDADKIVIFAQDQADDEWNEAQVFIDVPSGTSETAVDLLQGDHIETRTRMIINKKNTSTAILDKVVAGSLLSDNVTITTTDT